MSYNETTGRQTAPRWQLARPALSYGKPADPRPDDPLLTHPADPPGIAVQEKLIQLIDSGWLKANPVSRLIGRPNKVSALLKARRHPNDARYRVHQLRHDEIGQIVLFLDELASTLDAVLFFANRAPDNQVVTQAEVRRLLGRPELDTVNIRLGRTSRELARFWAFMRGQPARSEDLDDMLSRLRPLLDLLR